MAAGCSLAACGASKPPGTAASKAQITQTVVSFNALTMAGDGEAACKLKDDQSLPRGMAHITPGIHDCVSLWTKIGPTFGPAARQRALDDRPVSIAITDTRAAATMQSGARLQLVWTGDRWKLR